MALAAKVIANSGNTKLGPGMAATYTAFSSCPETCPIREDCYGRFGRMVVKRTFGQMHLAGEGLTPDEIAQQEAELIRRLPAFSPLRLHVVGDCKTAKAAEILAEAAEDYLNRGGPAVFGYTHSWRDVPRNAWGRISILASCEGPQDCINALERGYAAVVILPVDENPDESVRFYKSQGIKLRLCLHDLDGTPCVKCTACMNADWLRDHGRVIGLRAHATSKRRLSKKIRGCR